MSRKNYQYPPQTPAESVQSFLQVQLSETSRDPTHAAMEAIKMEEHYTGAPFELAHFLTNTLEQPSASSTSSPISVTNNNNNSTNTPANSTPSPRKRTILSEDEKARIIHNWEFKRPKTEILHDFGIGESTFYRVIKDRAHAERTGNSGTPGASKRHSLSLEEKVRIIHSWDSKVPRTEILSQFQIGESTFYRVIKERGKVIEKYPSMPMPPVTPERKRNILSLEDKVRIIQNWDNKKPKSEILSEYQIGESTFYRIIKNRSEVTDKYLEGRPEMKRDRPAKHPDLEARLAHWMRESIANHMRLDGPLVKQTAMMIANTLQATDFVASNGWLEGFKSRHRDLFP